MHIFSTTRPWAIPARLLSNFFPGPPSGQVSPRNRYDGTHNWMFVLPQEFPPVGWWEHHWQRRNLKHERPRFEDEMKYFPFPVVSLAWGYNNASRNTISLDGTDKIVIVELWYRSDPITRCWLCNFSRSMSIYACSFWSTTYSTVYYDRSHFRTLLCPPKIRSFPRC